MDQQDDQNIQAQNVNSQPVQPPQNPVPSQPQEEQVQSPVSPVSSPLKEQVPVVQSFVHEEIVSKEPEWIKPSEVELQISQEVKEAGVEVVSQKPIIKPGVQVEHAKESTPVQTQPMGIVQLLNKVEEEGADKKSTTESGHWLWFLLKKISKQLGINKVL